MSKKKKILEEIDFDSINNFTELEHEESIKSGQITPMEIHISNNPNLLHRIAICRTIVSFKNRNNFTQKNLCDILGADKSTISLVCSYRVQDRLSETRLFKMIQKAVMYENSYTAYDELNINLKESTPLVG